MPRDSAVSRDNAKRRSSPGWAAALILILVVQACGCSTTRYIQKRHERSNALVSLVSHKGMVESPRTDRLLQRFDLDKQYKDDPNATILTLESQDHVSQESERVYAIAELAYIQGQEAQRRNQSVDALRHFARAISASYQYLFSPALAQKRNPYDPQFRDACNLYNEALEDTLRLLLVNGKLQPGKTYEMKSGDRTHTIHTRLDESWDTDDFVDFDHFEFCSQYEIQTLNNRHTTYGLGVPLIAVRKKSHPDNPMEKYYPDELSFPCTALLDCYHHPSDDQSGAAHSHCEMVFYNPMRRTRAEFGGTTVPLQTDITTPLAFFLDHKQFGSGNIATIGLLKPNKVRDKQGLYMLEAYDPKRIPVLMVHGLWSSPMTWMDMFNDLRSFPEIRERYQFWFYLYPTGQPFWISAVQMRKDMKVLRERIVKQYAGNDLRTLDQTILVGHSMGGLVSRMQTIDSGNEFWRIVSENSFDQLKADDEDRARLASTLFFHPDNSVKRVVTIGTPHKGSDYSNSTTQWLGHRLIKLPTFLTNTSNRLIRNNPDYFRNTEMLTTTTSIDSLSPKSPIFPVMSRAKRNPNVRYHNVIGLVSTRSLLGRIKHDSDGVVERESAALDIATSEIIVEAQHTEIHTKPKTILEVRRVLLDHAQELDSRARIARLPHPDTEPIRVAGIEPIGGNSESTYHISDNVYPVVESHRLSQAIPAPGVQQVSDHQMSTATPGLPSPPIAPAPVERQATQWALPPSMTR